MYRTNRVRQQLNLTFSCLFKQLILPPSTSRLAIVPKNTSSYTVELMSSRRTRATSFTHAELNGLVLKLQALLPDSSSSCTTKVPALKILKETCRYIKRLHGEVNDLSDRLSHMLASMDNNSVDLDVLRSFLQQ